MKSKSQPEESQGRILVVDDIPQNLQILTHLLSKLNYTVSSVTSGQKALKVVKEKCPDLILLDICMPEMDGYEVCQALKADEAFRNIPVIFISALDEVLDKVKAFQSGGVDYIPKPFQVEEVIARIESQLIIQRQKRALETEIARHKQTEEVLYHSRALLSSILNTSLDGIAAMQAVRNWRNGNIEDFRCLVVNPILSKALGINREDWNGDGVAKQILNRIYPELFQRLVNVVETGEVLSEDLYYPLGNSCWYHLIAVKLGDGFAITVRDITSRKDTEITLQESENCFASIFHNFPVPVWICTLAEGRFLNVNNSLCQFLGVTPEEILHKTSAELGLWEELDKPRHYRHILVKEGMLKNFEMVVYTKSGEAKNIVISAQRERLNGQYCVIGMITDIRKEQNLKRQTETMPSLDGLRSV